MSQLTSSGAALGAEDFGSSTPDGADDSGSLHDAAAVRKVTNRLKRAQGQLAAVIAAVESGADCRDVVTQLSAVSSALDRAGFVIVSTAMRQCIADGDSEADADSAAGLASRVEGRGKLTVDELEKLFLTLA